MAGEPVVFGLEVKGADVVAQAYRQVTAEVTRAADAEAKAAAASKSVTAAATAQAESVKEAGRQSAVTATAARAVAPAAEAAAVGMKSAAAAGQNLRFQMADVFTSLAGGMNPLMVLAQQGPQIAEAFGGASKSADVLKAALGPAAGLGGVVLALAPAVLAAGGAFLYLNAQLKEAEATAKAASDAATKAQGAYDRLRESQRVQTVQAAVLAGQFGEGAIGTTEAQIAAERQFGEVRTQAAAKVAQSEARLLELRKQVQTASAGAQNSDNAITIAKANTEIRKKTDELGRNRDALGEVDRQIANTAASIVEWTERVKTSTSTVRAAVPVLEVYRAAVDGLYPVGLAQSGADLIRQINAIAPAAKTAADTVNELEASIGAINLAKLTGKIGADVADGLIFQVESKLGDLEMKGLTAALSDSFVSSAASAMQKLQADADRMAAEYQRRIEDRTRRIGQGASSLMSGDLMGALGAAVGRSPTGAAVMAGVQGLGALGAQGADATAKQIEATAMGVVKGLRELGPLLAAVIPSLVGQLPSAIVKAIPAIIAGLMEALPIIAVEMVKATGQLAYQIIALPVRLLDGVPDALAKWWRNVWREIRDFIAGRGPTTELTPEIQARLLADVQKQQATTYAAPALPAGATVRTAPEYRPQAAMFASPAPSGGGAAGGGFGSSTVHVHMPPGLMVGTADEVVRKLSQHLGTGGRRLTLPPGSVRA
jgi:hypothetical protein